MKTPGREPSIRNRTDEEVFRAYMEDLRLTPEDFNKKLLDVGAGAAQFAKWAKEHGVSQEIYSLEPRGGYISEKEKSVAARAEAIPFADESFDLVVSNAAIPNMYIGEWSTGMIKGKIKNSLQEMVRVLKPGGEIRLARVLIGKKDGPQKQNIEEGLKNLEARGGVKIERIKTQSDNTYEYDKNHSPTRLLAESYLIIIRKQIM